MAAVGGVARDALSDESADVVGECVGIGFAERLDEVSGEDAAAVEAAVEDALVFAAGGKYLADLAVSAGEFCEVCVVEGRGSWRCANVTECEAAVAGVDDEEDVLCGDHREPLVAEDLHG